MSWKIACTEGSHSTLQHDNSRCSYSCSTLNGGGDVCLGDGLYGELASCRLDVCAVFAAFLLEVCMYTEIRHGLY